VNNYQVECCKQGDWWAVRIPELKGCHTQARSLAEVEFMARDAIALLLEVPLDSFTLSLLPMTLEAFIAGVVE